MKKFLIALLMLFSLFLTGCDFIIKETAELDASDFTFIKYELIDENDSYQVAVTATCDYDIYKLVLDFIFLDELDNELNSSSLTVSSNFAQSEEFTIYIDVTYELYCLVDDIDVIFTGFAYVTQSNGLVATYRVTYIFNNGDDNLSVKVTKGQKVLEPDQPISDGFIFAGWYTESSFKNKFDFNTEITANTYLYAFFATDIEKYIEDIKDEVLAENITVKTEATKKEGLHIYLISSTGSGVIFHETQNYYYFLTNNHVTTPATGYTLSDYSVMDYKYNWYDNVNILYQDPAYDLAVGRFKKSSFELQVANLESSNALKSSDVIAVGQPNGSTNTVTLGTISSYIKTTLSDDSTQSNVTFDVIKHTAETATGSSGGALYNSDLCIVGISYAGATTESGEFVYSLAIPIEKVHEFLELNFWNLTLL